MMISLESSLGIQFGHGCVSLVYLKKLLRKIVLDHQEIIFLPEELPSEEIDPFLTKEIARVIRQKNISTENAWIGLPRQDIVLRFFSLPASAEENLSEVIRYEAGKYISLPIEETVYDYTILERETHAPTLKLLLALVKRKVFDRYYAILEEAGIQPIGVELSTTALVNGLFSGKNGSIPRDAVAFLSVDSRCFETAWIHNSTLRYSHVIAFDGKPDENRAVKVEKEIRNSFRIAFPAQPGNTAEENASEPVVYLLGTDLPDTLIADTVQNSDCTVQVLPMEAFTSQVKSTPPVPHSLAVALGLALRGMKKMPCELNLLPHPLRKKTRKMGVYLSIILFLVMIVLTITWGVSSVAKKRLVLHTIEQEIAALKDDVEAIQKIQEQARFFQDKIKSVERVQSFEDSNLKILKELSMIVPPSVWLTNLRYYRNEVQLSGYAQSSSELIAILDGSPLFCSSEFTAPITRDPQGQESFRITTRIEKKTESGSQ